MSLSGLHTCLSSSSSFLMSSPFKNKCDKGGYLLPIHMGSGVRNVCLTLIKSAQRNKLYPKESNSFRVQLLRRTMVFYIYICYRIFSVLCMAPPRRPQDQCSTFTGIKSYDVDSHVSLGYNNDSNRKGRGEKVFIRVLTLQHVWVRYRVGEGGGGRYGGRERGWRMREVVGEEGGREGVGEVEADKGEGGRGWRKEE